MEGKTNYTGRKEQMAKLRSEGVTYQAIGEMYGVSKQRVEQIIKKTPRDEKVTVNKRLFMMAMANKMLTQGELAKKSNVSQTTISFIKNGKAVRLLTVAKLANALGCAVADLVEME